MRCPKCHHDQKYKDGMKCGKCRYQFVFNPKTDKLLDNTISQMIQRLSDNNQYYFTRTQLAIEICKYWWKKKSSPFPKLFLVVFIGIIFLFTELWPFAVIIFGVIVFFMIMNIGDENSVSFGNAKTAIQRYHTVHPIEKLVDGKAFVKMREEAIQTEIPPNTLKSKEEISTAAETITNTGQLSIKTPAIETTVQHEPQTHCPEQAMDGKTFVKIGKAFLKIPVIEPSIIYDEFFFAPERLLIVERDEFVDMLIRNRFHQNTKTVIVSQTGYPAYVFTACQTFLKKNPNMPVQMLHDASLKGFGMSQRIRNDAKWRFAQNNLVDIGLSRQSLAEKEILLPWLLKFGDNVVFSKKYQTMLSENRKVPIDYVPPKPLLNGLSTAVVGGVLLLAILEDLTVEKTVSYEDYG